MSVHLAKGTRDFLPAQMINRQRVIDTLRGVFTRFGFEPLETPAFERIETLTGKYGDEGSKLMYRILKRGEGGQRGEVDLALRYDLTVPLARVAAMNAQLRLPFKRYQVQPVWRADRPAKGRFREFYQCDVDILGTEHPSADAECLAVVSASLQALGFDKFTIRLNDRRILRALAASHGATDEAAEMAFLISLDKLDKIGRAGVEKELAERGLAADTERLWATLAPQSTNQEALDHLAAELPGAQEGIDTLRRVLALALALGVPEERLRIDATLARGLDYYTGPVFETVVDEPNVGSISGGGRYDNLIGMFSGRQVPAVGVSLGLERIVTVMEELGMLPETATAAQVLVTVFDEERLAASVHCARVLREAGIDAELFLDDKNLKKQFKYANARGFPWLIVIGPDEATSGHVNLKNLKSGDQRLISVDELSAFLATSA